MKKVSMYTMIGRKVRIEEETGELKCIVNTKQFKKGRRVFPAKKFGKRYSLTDDDVGMIHMMMNVRLRSPVFEG